MIKLTEDELSYCALKIAHAYREEIIRLGDWFFNLDEYTLNFIQSENSPSTYRVLAYEAEGSVTDWAKEFILPSVTFEGSSSGSMEKHNEII